jgi:hypothetical protein
MALSKLRQRLLCRNRTYLTCEECSVTAVLFLIPEPRVLVERILDFLQDLFAGDRLGDAGVVVPSAAADLLVPGALDFRVGFEARDERLQNPNTVLAGKADRLDFDLIWRQGNRTSAWRLNFPSSLIWLGRLG